MKNLLITLGLVLVTATNGCNSKDPTGPDSGKNRVLFIGNSYLFTMNIPDIVQAMAAYKGDDLTAVTVAGPDMALYDHLGAGTAVPTIAGGGWSYIVLQQGPSAVSYNRDSLRMATAIYDGLAKQVGAKTALFSAWPQYVNRADFPRAIESYRLAAEDVGGLFIPVASAWLKAWEFDPSLNLYADGLHPSAAGAYLAALVVYATITQKPPTGMPASIGGVSVDESTAAILQLAAASVTTK